MDIVQYSQKQAAKISEFHNHRKQKIFRKLLQFQGKSCIIVRHDVRRCERLLWGVSDPPEGIFTEHVRQSGENIDQRRPRPFGSSRSSAVLRRFSREKRGTRGTVLNRIAPQFPNSRGLIPTIYKVRAKFEKEAKTKAIKEKIRVRLKSYDHTLIDTAAEKIVAVAKANGSEVSGPIPLPTDREIVTILRSVHVNKDSREQFETRTHKRLIDIMKPSQKTVDALMSIELPAGVEIEVKL